MNILKLFSKNKKQAKEQPKQLSIGIVSTRFCLHKDKFLWSVFEDGSVLYECKCCGKRIEGENVGRIGYLGYLLKWANEC